MKWLAEEDGAPPNAIPLRDAPERFAPHRLRGELNEVLAATSLYSAPKRGDLVEVSRSIAQTLGSIGERMSRRIDIEGAMENALLDKLLKGKHQAWGVQAAPKQRRQRERIPSHFFLDANIDWLRNGVENLGVKFVGVVVARSAVQRATVHPASEKLSPGRPSKAAEVGKVIDHLLDIGIDPSKMPRRKAYKTIQAHARKLRFNVEIGFSDPVIQRALAARFGHRR